MEIINGYLVIFNDTTNNELVDSEGDGFLLVLEFPDKTFLLDGQDLLEQFIEIGLSFVGLHFEEEDGLGNRGSLLLCFLGLLLLFLKKLLGFLLIINKVTY